MVLFDVLANLLFLGAVAALVLWIWNLVAALAGWRGPHRRERLAASAKWFLAIPLLLAAQVGLVFLSQKFDGGSSAGVGAEATAFTLTDTTGETFDLAAHRGKVVLVNFFATWCGPCRMELPHLQELWEKYGSDERFALLVVGSGESDAKVSAFRSKGGFTLAMAADSDGSVSEHYAPRSIPMTYLIGPDGKIVYSIAGFSPTRLAKLEQELIKQLPLATAPPETASR